MKIIPEHFNVLKQLVAPLDTPELRAAYVEKDLSDMRYRWDCLWRAKLPSGFVSELYKYLNDDHIDTALRSFIPSLYSTHRS